MTISTTASRISYNGNGSTTAFSFPYRFFTNTDLVVVLVSAAGVETVQTLSTDYTVIGADSASGGTVTMTTAPASGTELVIYREVDITQEVDYISGGAFPAETHERALDRLTVIAQQLEDKAGRAVRGPVTDPITINMELPGQEDRADTVLTFNVNGEPQATPTDEFVAGLAGSVIGANYVTTNSTGDGSTVNFTVSTAPGAKGNIQIYIDGVYQNKSTFSISGTTVTFTEAPPSGAVIEFVVGYSIGSFTDAGDMTYTPAGTGAVTTTVQAKLRESVSVKDFGAVGDGVTDDTAAIQAALDAIPPYGFVDLSGLSYAVSGVVVSTNNVTVRNGRLVALSTASEAVIKAAPGTSGVQFENLRVYINKAIITAGDCAGIFFDQCSYGKAINCHVDGSKNNNYTTTFPSAIYGYMASKIDVISCSAINADKEGIMFRMCDDVYIYDCEARDSGYSNIGTSGGSRAIITGCRAFNSGATNITMNSQDSIVSDCLADTNALYNGILIGHMHETEQWANNCMVVNNRVMNSTDIGVAVVYGTNVVVQGNVITNAANMGVYVVARPDVVGGTVIDSNAISNVGRGIVYSANAATSVNITNNQIRDCVQGALKHGIQCTNLGEANIQGNTVRNAGTGVYAYGYYPNNVLGATGMLNLVVDGNVFRGIGLNGISAFNLHRLTVSDNQFSYINTANSASAAITKISASNGAIASFMPSNVLFTGNSTSNRSSNTTLVSVETNTLDATITRVFAGSNQLQDFTAATLFTGTFSTANYFTQNNQIGTDNRFIYLTIAPGATTTTVTNSNITAYGSLPQFVARDSDQWNLINVRITAVNNGSVSLAHSSPASNANANYIVA